jgi:DNA repair exonuclease SbcCD ATPase subunit
MPSTQSTTRILNFPILSHIRLSHFSLYTLKPTIEFKVGDGILCLAGANGLGKSTFLQVVIYGMTGIVPKPDRKFSSVDDYYRDTRSFTREYFEGRLLPEHRDIAEIELEMSIGNKQITITRGFVESESLRSLKVVSDNKEKDFKDETPEQRQATYEKLLIEESGLGSFREFVFVQSFVLTFDERRHLLFWDAKVLETCLLIFVGVKKEQRAEVEQLRRESEKAGSRVRNLSYDIKQAKDRLAELEAVRKGKKAGKEEAKTYEEYEGLVERVEETNETIRRIEAKIRDAKLAIADSAARSSALRTEYNNEFESRLKTKQGSRQHPYVQQAILDGKCNICGANGLSVSENIKAKIAGKECPFCGTPFSVGKQDAHTMARLMELDKALVRERKILDSKSLQVNQLEEEKQQCSEELSAFEKELKDFEEENRDVVTRSSAGGKGLADLSKVYREQIQSLTRQRDEERDHSQKTDQKYRGAKKQLEQQYMDVRAKFVPEFNALATLFLGVELDIVLENRENVVLVLEINKSRRRADYQLSESQRFFIDIALRMAFAKFVSTNGAGVPLYIDTPEGSLDLAYEAQAGQMLAKFATDGHNILMTANVNTSQLLRSLATNAKSCGFAIQRLYRWTELSAVQEKQETKFDETLNMLEKLAKSGAK